MNETSRLNIDGARAGNGYIASNSSLAGSCGRFEKTYSLRFFSASQTVERWWLDMLFSKEYQKERALCRT